MIKKFENFNVDDPYDEEDWNDKMSWSRRFNEDEIKLLNEYGYEMCEYGTIDGNYAIKYISKKLYKSVQKNKPNDMLHVEVIPFLGVSFYMTDTELFKETDLLDCLKKIEEE